MPEPSERIKAPPKRFAAVDTRFLLALADNEETCQGVIDLLPKLGFYFLVTSTVIQELADIELSHPDRNVRDKAKECQTCLPIWGILDFPLSALENGFALVLANKLLHKKIISSDFINDGLVVTEAAFHQCTMLVTTRGVLLDAEYQNLRLALIEGDAADLLIVSPDALLEYFDGIFKHKK